MILKIFVAIFLYCLNCTKFDELILSKVIKTVATRCHIFSLKYTKFGFGCGANPDPARGAYRDNHPPVNTWSCVPSRFPLLLSTLSGATFTLSVSRLHIICMAFNLPTFDVKYTRNRTKNTEKSVVQSVISNIIKHKQHSQSCNRCKITSKIKRLAIIKK